MCGGGRMDAATVKRINELATSLKSSGICASMASAVKMATDIIMRTHKTTPSMKVATRETLLVVNEPKDSIVIHQNDKRPLREIADEPAHDPIEDEPDLDRSLDDLPPLPDEQLRAIEESIPSYGEDDYSLIDIAEDDTAEDVLPDDQTDGQAPPLESDAASPTFEPAAPDTPMEESESIAEPGGDESLADDTADKSLHTLIPAQDSSEDTHEDAYERYADYPRSSTNAPSEPPILTEDSSLFIPLDEDMEGATLPLETPAEEFEDDYPEEFQEPLDPQASESQNEELDAPLDTITPVDELESEDSVSQEDTSEESAETDESSENR